MYVLRIVCIQYSTPPFLLKLQGTAGALKNGGADEPKKVTIRNSRFCSTVLNTQTRCAVDATLQGAVGHSNCCIHSQPSLPSWRFQAMIAGVLTLTRD